MKEVFKSMLNHPIATFIVAGTLLGGVADIVAAIKGDRKPTGVCIAVQKPESATVE